MRVFLLFYLIPSARGEGRRNKEEGKEIFMEFSTPEDRVAASVPEGFPFLKKILQR